MWARQARLLPLCCPLNGLGEVAACGWDLDRELLVIPIPLAALSANHRIDTASRADRAMLFSRLLDHKGLWLGVQEIVRHGDELDQLDWLLELLKANERVPN